jgi:hypothetical protein
VRERREDSVRMGVTMPASLSAAEGALSAASIDTWRVAASYSGAERDPAEALRGRVRLGSRSGIPGDEEDLAEMPEVRRRLLAAEGSTDSKKE